MTQTSQSGQTSLAALRGTLPSPDMRAGFDTVGGFELMQRGARLLANSTIVPPLYRAMVEDKKSKALVANPSAISNCVVALNMAQRVRADPLMIMQNLYIVEGRPGWSGQYIIAAINACGKFSPLRFMMEDRGEKEVEWTTVVWEGQQGQRRSREVQHKVVIHNKECTAWAIEKATGERLDGPTVSMEMAVAEGWYGKNGSKWQTMPEVMLRYRAASFFGKLYAPELLMGLQTADELRDSVITIEAEPDPAPAVSMSDLRAETGGPAGESSDEPSPPETGSAPEADQDDAPLSPQLDQPGTVNRPTKEEMEARREAARAAWEATGHPLSEAEQRVNAFAHKWNSAQCQRVSALAHELRSDSERSEPEPQDSLILCPAQNMEIDAERCSVCPDRETCSAW